MATEKWKSVPTYEGVYEASNKGRIRSIDRMVKARGNSWRTQKGIIMKSRISSCGYCKINLSANSKAKTFFVHRLVMLAFRGESDLDVNHLNGNKTDNRLVNLEYGTTSYNIKHAYDNKLMSALGVNNGRSKLTEEQVLDIVYKLNSGLAQKDIATQYDISSSVVSKISVGKSWNHITNRKKNE